LALVNISTAAMSQQHILCHDMASYFMAWRLSMHSDRNSTVRHSPTRAPADLATLNWHRLNWHRESERKCVNTGLKAGHAMGGNRRLKAGFLLARMKAVPAAKRPFIKDKG
jgi:hypothetical protein